MSIEINQRPESKNQKTAAPEELNFQFQVGAEPFSVSIKDLDLRHTLEPEASASALKTQIDVIGVATHKDLQAVWPYNSELIVTPYESTTIAVPSSSVTIMSNNVFAKEPFDTIFPRGAIKDSTGHTTLFDGAPARIEAGTLIGTLAT